MPMEEGHEELDWDVNPLNPHNWSLRKRWLHFTVAAAVTWTITLASSIVALEGSEFRTHFHISRTVAKLPFAIFLLALAFGTFIGQLCAKMLGRKVTYMVSFLLFAIFTLASGLVQTSYGLITCRALAGLFAGPALSVGSAIVSDLWRPEERTLPITIYCVAPILGPVVGVITGGYVLKALNGRWTQYVVLFAFAGCVVPVTLLSETHKPIILRRKQVGGQSAWPQLDRQAVEDALLAPLMILMKQPAVSLWSFCSAFNFAVLYASFIAIPGVWQTSYDFDLGTQGLTFASMAIGVLVAIVVLLLNHRFIYSPKATKWLEEEAAEAERAAEAEKALAAKRRASHRSSYQSTVSNFSRPNPRRTETNRESMNQSLSAFVAPSGSVRQSLDYQRNATMAVAAAAYINSLTANEGKRILPERIQLLLNKTPVFSDLCESLESQGLKVERVQLAKVLVDTLPSETQVVSSRTGQEPTSSLARSQSLHRSAAIAAFEAPAPLSALPRPSSPVPQPVPRKDEAPPAQWRLWPAFPATILLTGSLFVFGWTAQQRVHWVGPCFGMGIFACSLVIISVCVQLSAMDILDEEECAAAEAGSMVVRYMASFVFVMFVDEMYDGLSVGWATSVFGFLMRSICNFTMRVSIYAEEVYLDAGNMAGKEMSCSTRNLLVDDWYQGRRTLYSKPCERLRSAFCLSSRPLLSKTTLDISQAHSHDQSEPKTEGAGPGIGRTFSG